MKKQIVPPEIPFSMANYNSLTIDVEDWFHILDSPAVPRMERWSLLESRIEMNLDRILVLLDSYSVKATFFWLGWVAERHKDLVRKCQQAGHEIASHGYAHVLANEVGPDAFRQDISKAKAILEDITGEPVRGFRAPGFGIIDKALWAFEVIREAGYQYDSSVFPAQHGHGGMPASPVEPYFVETNAGHLLEIPLSVVQVLGRRISFFGGGYLRLASKRMIKWGIDRLEAAGQPLVVYIHPREIDPDQPRLPLPLRRRFKCYVGLKSTLPKLKWLFQNYSFSTMLGMVEDYIKSFYYQRKLVPVLTLPNGSTDIEPSLKRWSTEDIANHDQMRSRILSVERAMAGFLGPDTAQL
jgi:polysaccharide deacetylase family protein (PEP-CTERM system associated)